VYLVLNHTFSVKKFDNLLLHMLLTDGLLRRAEAIPSQITESTYHSLLPSLSCLSPWLCELESRAAIASLYAADGRGPTNKQTNTQPDRETHATEYNNQSAV